MVTKLKSVILLVYIFIPFLLFAQVPLKQIGTLEFEPLSKFDGVNNMVYDDKSGLFVYLNNRTLMAFDGKNEIAFNRSKYHDLTGFELSGDSLIVWNSKEVLIESGNFEKLLYQIGDDKNEIKSVKIFPDYFIVGVRVKNETDNTSAKPEIEFYKILNSDNSVTFLKRYNPSQDDAESPFLIYYLMFNNELIEGRVYYNDGVKIKFFVSGENNKPAVFNEKLNWKNYYENFTVSGNNFFFTVKYENAKSIYFGNSSFLDSVVTDISASVELNNSTIVISEADSENVYVRRFSFSEESNDADIIPLHQKGEISYIMDADSAHYFIGEGPHGRSEITAIKKVTDEGYFLGDAKSLIYSHIIGDTYLWNGSNSTLYKINQKKELEESTLDYLKSKQILKTKLKYPGYIQYVDSKGSLPLGFSAVGENQTWLVDEKKGLLSNHVEKITGENENSFWVMTDKGVQLYNVEERQFERTYNYSKLLNLQSDAIPNKLISIGENIYIYSDLSSNIYKIKNETIEEFGLPENQTLTVVSDSMYVIDHSDSSATIIYHYDPENDTFTNAIMKMDGKYLTNDSNSVFSFTSRYLFKFSFSGEKLDSSSLNSEDVKWLNSKKSYLDLSNIYIVDTIYLLFQSVELDEEIYSFIVKFNEGTDIELYNFKDSYFNYFFWKTDFGTKTFLDTPNSINYFDLTSYKLIKYNFQLNDNELASANIDLENNIFFLSYLDSEGKIHKVELPVGIPSKPGLRISNQTQGSDYYQQFSVNPDETVRFYFSGALQPNQKIHHYEFRIPELDKNWVSTSNTYQDFYYLKAGYYTFYCRFITESGEVSEIAELKFTVLPPWYQTIWAYFSFAIIVLIIIYGFVGLQVDLTKKKERQKFEKREYSRKTAELDKARNMQLSMLPHNNIENTMISIIGKMRPASEVGGDYYDFIRIDENRYCIAAGDATGHGNAAGLIVGMIKIALINSVREQHQVVNLTHLMTSMNLSLKESLNYRGMGMCLAVMIINVKTGEGEICSSGFPYPYFFRNQKNQLTPLVFHGPPLGLMRNAVFPSQHFIMQPGDFFYLMSDGFAERMNLTETMYGYEKIEEDIKSIIADGVEYGVDRLFALNDEFANGRLNDDDMTVVVVRKK